MTKWWGYVLTKHRQAIHIFKTYQDRNPKKEPLSEEQMSTILQLNPLGSGLYKETFTEIMKGFEVEMRILYIKTKMELKSIKLDLINTICRKLVN